MVLSPLTLSLPQAYRAPGMLVVQKVEVDPAATCASHPPRSLRHFCSARHASNFGSMSAARHTSALFRIR